MFDKILFLLNNTIERVLYAALSLMVDISSLTLIIMFDVQLNQYKTYECKIDVYFLCKFKRLVQKLRKDLRTLLKMDQS